MKIISSKNYKPLFQRTEAEKGIGLLYHFEVVRTSIFGNEHAGVLVLTGKELDEINDIVRHIARMDILKRIYVERKNAK